jgi:hypothetical protein
MQVDLQDTRFRKISRIVVGASLAGLHDAIQIDISKQQSHDGGHLVQRRPFKGYSSILIRHVNNRELIVDKEDG